MPTQIRNVQLPGREEWVDDEGIRLVGVHLPGYECEKYGCALHSPSDHEYRDLELVWSKVEEMFFRKTAEGDFIPDPDEIAFRQRESGKKYLADRAEYFRKFGALYPQADNVARVRARLANAGRDSRTVGDGQVLDALYAEAGDVEAAARALARAGFAPEHGRPVHPYLRKELIV